MSEVAGLVARSGDLKRQLVVYGTGPRFAAALRRTAREYGGEVDAIDEGARINLIDTFILEHVLPDRRTIVEHFVAANPRLPEAERAMLLGWRDVVTGVFEVGHRDGDALIMTNLVDELTYRVWSNCGPSAFGQMPRRSYVLTRLVPVADEWLLSGASSTIPASLRAEALRIAARLALHHPRLVFRNPEKLALGWEFQHKERAAFIELFGADLIIVAGADLQRRMDEFMHFRTHIQRDEDGTTVADRVRKTRGYVPPLPSYDLPDDLVEAASVGIIYDEVEGLTYLCDYAVVVEAFADPRLATDPRHRRKVLSYLKDDSVAPMALRRLADEDPDRASRLFQKLLKRTTFSWERDGEALLRKHKRAHFERTPLPGITPVSDTLTNHYRAINGQAPTALDAAPAPTARAVLDTKPALNGTAAPGAHEWHILPRLRGLVGLGARRR